MFQLYQAIIRGSKVYYKQILPVGRYLFHIIFSVRSDIKSQIKKPTNVIIMAVIYVYVRVT
jgi:hypothetical protein